MCPDFPESAIPFRQSFMLNRPETVVPNRPEVSASDLISVFFRFFIFHTYAYFHFSSDACFLFRLIRFFRLYSCFRPSSLHSYSLLFPIFPQSRPASSGFTPASVLHPYTRIRFYFRFFPQSRPAFSGFTPVFVLHPYTRIRSYFRFSPNPAPLLPALLLFSSFIIPAFALVSDFSPNPVPLLPALLLLPSFILTLTFVLISDFPPIPPRFFRLYSCFRPSSLYLHLFLLISSLHIHFFMLVSVPTFLLSLVFMLSALLPLMPPVFLHCFRFRTPVFTSSAFVFPCSIPHPYPYPFSFPLSLSLSLSLSLPLPLPLPLPLARLFPLSLPKKSLIKFPLANGLRFL